MSANSSSLGQKMREARQLSNDLVTAFNRTPSLTPEVVAKYDALFTGLSTSLHEFDLLDHAQKIDLYRCELYTLASIQELLKKREEARTSGESVESLEKQLAASFSHSLMKTISISKIRQAVMAEKTDYHAAVTARRMLSSLPECKQSIKS